MSWRLHFIGSITVSCSCYAWFITPQPWQTYLGWRGSSFSSQRLVAIVSTPPHRFLLSCSSLSSHCSLTRTEKSDQWHHSNTKNFSCSSWKLLVSCARRCFMVLLSRSQTYRQSKTAYWQAYTLHLFPFRHIFFCEWYEIRPPSSWQSQSFMIYPDRKKKPMSRSHKFMFGVTVFMFLLSTAYWTVSLGNLIDTINTYFSSNPNRLTIWSNLFPLFNSLLLINVSEVPSCLKPVQTGHWLLLQKYVLTDCVVVWRAWVLCKFGGKKIFLVPMLFLLCTSCE